MIYKEFKGLDLPAIDHEIRSYWEANRIFEKSIETRNETKSFVFYEGPPSANGMPGIHHVVGRTIKDIFCRYKTLQGYRVERKGGWDTHGLPIELKVEKDLGITKEDIGVKISIEQYNQKCRETVWHFKEKWDELTQIMGYWLDLDHPYVTYENEYIESVWNIIQKINDKNLLYQGLTIQPFSPAAGTGLSTHELNQPGTYRDVTDTTAVACFKILDNHIEKLQKLFNTSENQLYFLAWTTTPWTLPSNTALCLGPKIEYSLVRSFNPYTKEPQTYILAKDLIEKWFKKDHLKASNEILKFDEKNIPFQILGTCLGNELIGIEYEQLLPFESNQKSTINGKSFETILGQFVTTTDGTGIVHIAPSFGADDRKVAMENGIGELTMVDREGKFKDGMGYLTGRFVKDYRDETDYKNPDIDIAIDLKTKGLAFNVQKYVHSYPHCWRTDKPILYYPLDSWFVQMTAVKDQMIANNKKINWKPESTGTGRFGQWLENIQDWNLSRSRFWGIPLPIWMDYDRKIILCIGGKQELLNEISKANLSGLLSPEQIERNTEFTAKFDQNEGDFHKPFIDKVTLTKEGKVLQRELDVIDVWFDSGSMPFAQWNYPFSNQDKFKQSYPADFIAEGVDQTRGWFYTLHAISTILFDQPAYKNVISNGLVLDKNGVKMSKRLGNVVDPFETISSYGADAVRWYIISNSAPWDNLKFDLKGIEEVRRKLFGTLYNTYSFFTLYANIDQFVFDESKLLSISERPELDQWILSKLNSLKLEVTKAFENYEPTVAARAIEEFVDRNLSNWYIRLSRRRFWKNDINQDKNAAYQTLFECMVTLTQLMSPIAPFFSDWMYQLLTNPIEKDTLEASSLYNFSSIHLTPWKSADQNTIDTDLERRVALAQDISSMILSLRKKEQIKVRQPLQKVLIPILNPAQQQDFESIESIVKSEVNIKEMVYLKADSGMFNKSAKANFKLLGKKLGKDMAQIANEIAAWNQDDISKFELNKSATISNYTLNIEEIEITTSDMPGFLVISENGLTLALDITLNEALVREGLAREFINRVQNYRKDTEFNITDKIHIEIEPNQDFEPVIASYTDYISTEILASKIDIIPQLSQPMEWDINNINIKLTINKL